MKEIWQDIPQWEGYYQVSNLGRVKTLKRKTIDRLGRKRARKEKVLKQAVDKHGYNYVIFRLNDYNRTYKVHRLVALCFIGKSKLQVNHKNLIKTDNNLSNLEYVTQSQNMKHARKNKVYKKYYRKLSKRKHFQIVFLHLLGVQREEISKLFNIHPNTVYKLIKGL